MRPEGVYVDCTLGGGGHSAAIFSRLAVNGRLIAFDRDADAISAGGKWLRSAKGDARLDIVQTNFEQISAVLRELQIDKVDGILADLGVSSWQLDEKSRGFTYREDAPLDMRMDNGQKLDAATVVNTYPQEKLKKLIREYGEERYAGRISQAIVRQRQKQPLQTTGQLADLICRTMPASSRREDQHPARRTFQAIRIEVNNELGALKQLLQQAIELLRADGRICVISFHSLEDRIVKETFRNWENPCICPRDFPVCTCGRKPLGRAMAKKGRTAASPEMTGNPRSTSARLRCFVRNNYQEVDHG